MRIVENLSITLGINPMSKIVADRLDLLHYPEGTLFGKYLRTADFGDTINVREVNFYEGYYLHPKIGEHVVVRYNYAIQRYVIIRPCDGFHYKNINVKASPAAICLAKQLGYLVEDITREKLTEKTQHLVEGEWKSFIVSVPITDYKAFIDLLRESELLEEKIMMTAFGLNHG